VTDAVMPLNDSALISLLRRRAEALVNEDDAFRVEAIHERGWAVVPVESALHFDQDDATRLATAIGHIAEEVYAVAVEGLHDVQAVYRVRATREGLLSFSAECGLFTYLLIPSESDRFAVLCSVADYYLVAGSEEFVEEANGADIITAYSSFEKFATDRALPAEKQASLKRLISMYRAATSTSET